MSGRPGTRQESGPVYRWAEGWFCQINASLGWSFAKGDKAAIDQRVEWLSNWLSPPRSATRAIEDEPSAIVVFEL